MNIERSTLNIEEKESEEQVSIHRSIFTSMFDV